MPACGGDAKPPALPGRPPTRAAASSTNRPEGGKSPAARPRTAKSGGGWPKGRGRVVVFATKPGLACRIIERFLDAGHSVGRVTGDGVYGSNSKLRAALEERGIDHILAVACSAKVPTGAGKFRVDALRSHLNW
ncbi:transposase [Streptomyces sp. NPDC058620]|uniref:transposase n=1 Tax=Streptomyces sp. NPDC058620 TaxID=3346560 RepID=UPI003658B9AE